MAEEAPEEGGGLERGRIELHAHTKASDGALTPTELVERARSLGLETLAVTDHDTTAGIAEAEVHGSRVGLEVLPAVELTCGLGEDELHVLGYLLDPAEEALQSLLRTIRTDRHRRFARMLEKLAALGIELGPPPASIEGHAPTRAHLAQMLIRAGAAASVKVVFQRFLGFGCPGYEPKTLVQAEDAIERLHAAGAVAVLAHPGAYREPPDLERLVRAGLDGLEAHYPTHSSDQTRALVEAARARALVTTGGSDFHHEDGRCDLGRQRVPPDVLERLREAAERVRG